MSNMRGIRFWKNWGLVSRLMLAVGIAIITGGGVQTALLVAEGAAEHSARLKRELNETLTFMAPLIADQALVGLPRSGLSKALKAANTAPHSAAAWWCSSRKRGTGPSIAREAGADIGGIP